MHTAEQIFVACELVCTDDRTAHPGGESRGRGSGDTSTGLAPGNLARTVISPIVTCRWSLIGGTPRSWLVVGSTRCAWRAPTTSAARRPHTRSPISVVCPVAQHFVTDLRDIAVIAFEHGGVTRISIGHSDLDSLAIGVIDDGCDLVEKVSIVE